MDIKYLVRLDDACPTMDAKRWGRIERILDKYGIRPLVGVIPDNRDVTQQIDSPDHDFWKKVRSWEKKGWAIAMHGYDHVYSSRGGGINPVQLRSEFAGLSLQKQEEKILRGREILQKQGIDPAYFFAPSHTFDRNTLEALNKHSQIRIISDTFAFYPYQKYGFVFIPVQCGRFRKIRIPGLWTFCFHPNMMGNDEFEVFENFIDQNIHYFSSVDRIDLTVIKEQSFTDRGLSDLYLAYRKLRRLL